MTYAAYLVTTSASYQYAGRTGVLAGETLADAVRERLAQHNADPQSALYGHLQDGRALFDSYGPYQTETAATEKERALYDAIPWHLRLNRVRP